LLKKLDKNGNGTVEYEELVSGLKDLGFDLSYQEAYTVMRYFDTSGNWKLSMKDLYEGIRHA